MSSGNQYSYPPPNFQQSAPKKSNTTLIVLIVIGAVAVPMLVICLGVMVGLLLPAVQAAREAARRMECSNNEKMIALALYNYESTYKRFPPAYTVDENGNRLHSWRTLILPFMEQSVLYDQIDLDKPWNDPVNLPLSEVVIPTFSCPSSTNHGTNLTNYVAVVDATGIFSGEIGTRLGDVVDGTSNTIMFVEVPAEQAVPWMSPQDIGLDEYINLPQRSHHAGGSNVAIADGSVKFIVDDLSPEQRKALISKGGAEYDLHNLE